MTQEQANEIKERAVKSASQVRMEDVLSLCGYMGKTKKRGVNLYFQCPNGCDNKASLDKCSINTDSNLAYCFSCREGFGPAKLVQVYKDIPYIEGALFLAYKTGDITKEEYDECSHNYGARKKLLSDSNIYEKLEKKRATEEVEYNAPSWKKDLVYRHLLMMPQFALAEEHKEYLEKRGISKYDPFEFFSYTKPFSIDELIKSIKKEKPEFTYNDFWGIAGFYFEFSNKEKTKGRWRFRKPYESCLGIALKNAKGEIVALQMRYMKDSNIANKKVNKYFFVTSRGYKPSDAVETGFGASSGSPAHCEYPETITNPMILIGEGKFKMREAKKENSVALSCQGVGNYSYIVDEVEEVLASPLFASKLSPKLSLERMKEKMCFCIMYDADMFRNFSVLDAGIKLAKSLKSRYKKDVYFLLWEEEYGKGFDDMKSYAMLNRVSYKDLCFTMKADDFVKFAEMSIAECDKRFVSKGQRADNIRKSKEYTDALYHSLWVLKCRVYSKK